MFIKSDHSRAIVVADIESGSAGVALMKCGASPALLAHAREELPFEDRDKDALRFGIVQALNSAAEKMVAEYTKAGKTISAESCYCVVGAPWSRSFPASAHSRLDRPTSITDTMIGALAKQALAGQKDVEAGNILEANVTRVLLNGYPTQEPAGKRADEIDIFTLISDCDPDFKNSAQEALGKSLPGVPAIWRSSARAILAATRQVESAETCLIVEVGSEATDLISLRTGILEQRMLVQKGTRTVLESLAKERPVEETLALVDMLEKDQCETEACESLRRAIAKTEPELVHLFGEALAKLATPRKLPDEMLLIAPPALAPWLSRFFARIDFTQFTASTKPFTVSTFSAGNLTKVPRNDPALFTDPGLSIACNLVNMELSS